MPQIIAGTKKNLHFQMPKKGTRPMLQRTKESVFQRIETNFFSFGELSVLDLFAGSGALGLEALSRGAKSCIFVENNMNAIKTLKNNLKKSNFTNANVIKEKSENYILKTNELFDIIFIDPPFLYSDYDVNKFLDNIENQNILTKYGLIIVQRSKHSASPIFQKNYNVIEKKYGASIVIIAQRM
jgi:16S rRNA (guanine966-N2)-methyltransferase